MAERSEGAEAGMSVGRDAGGAVTVTLADDDWANGAGRWSFFHSTTKSVGTVKVPYFVWMVRTEPSEVTVPTKCLPSLVLTVSAKARPGPLVMAAMQRTATINHIRSIKPAP